jgi:NADH-quinone oxidoreductase subunit J
MSQSVRRFFTVFACSALVISLGLGCAKRKKPEEEAGATVGAGAPRWPDMIAKLVFAFLAVLVLVPAGLAVTVKNIFHSALWLVLSLTGVAGLFALLGADFLFVAQILVYTGGITVLLLFVVLLSGSPKDWIVRQVNGQWAWGLALSAIFVGLLATLFKQIPEPAELTPAAPTSAPLGLMLVRDMLLPFEAVSLVLLAALVGAIHFSKRNS